MGKTELEALSKEKLIQLILVLQALEEKVDGSWEFYVDITSENIIPWKAATTPTATPSPLAEQTISRVTMTLDWVFTDTKRVAFGYTITDLPDVSDTLYLGGTMSRSKLLIRWPSRQLASA